VAHDPPPIGSVKDKHWTLEDIWSKPGSGRCGQALADGENRILGVVAAWVCVNSDSAASRADRAEAHAGGPARRKLLPRCVYGPAGEAAPADPLNLSYEAHGTGTAVGDPLEKPGAIGRGRGRRRIPEQSPHAP